MSYEKIFNPAHAKLLGTMTDLNLSKLLRLSESTIRLERSSRKIESFGKKNKKKK